MDPTKHKKRFAHAMASLAEVFDSGRENSAVKMEIYFKALSSFTIEEIEQGVATLIRTRTTATFPKPAEIIEAIQGTKQDKATEAWLQVLKAVRTIGPARSVKFTDPVIHSALDGIGGWTETGEWLDVDLKWKQKEFERLYMVCSQFHPSRHPEYLIGEADQSNRDRGFLDYIKPPILIGQDERKALDGPKVRQLKEVNR